MYNVPTKPFLVKNTQSEPLNKKFMDLNYTLTYSKGQNTS